MRNNCDRAHAATFSNQYSWCRPLSTVFATHSAARRKSVSMLGAGRGRSNRGWYPRPQAHMNSAMVVMQDPTVEKVLEMPLTQRDEEV